MFKRKKTQSSNKMRHLIAKISPQSPISEQYRTIRTNLQFASVDEPLQSILITSAGPSSGKSLTAANLAVVYAQQGKKTLLIDADMRKPTVHYTFRIDNLSGLSNMLVGDTTLEQAVSPSDVDNLDVLTCGPIPPNPAELLASKRMEEILKQANQLYDFVIFDTPPLLAVTDAKILANIVDGCILVIRSNVTKMEEVEKATDLLDDGRAKVLGAILNDKEKKESAYYYYYGT